MSVVVWALQALLGLSLAAWLTYAGIVVRAARLWLQARRPLDPEWTPPVTILKPVRGIDPEAYDNFASFCRQDYPADRVQILFGALDPSDPALALARQLQGEFPDSDIGIVCSHSEALQGPNLKVCNLASLLPEARHSLIVLADSDMRVEPDYLRRIVAHFQPPNTPTSMPAVGLVTCPYRGWRAASFAAVLEALGIGADFIPSVLASRMLEGVGFAFGSTIALPRAVLAEIGGFESLREELADDFRLGESVRRAGYEVVLSDYVVDDALGAERFGPMWARRLRWARTVRACRPVGYAGSLVTHGIALALCLLAATGFRGYAWVILAAVLILRALTALYVAECCTADSNVRRFLFLLPISDLLSFTIFLASFLGNRITWRGERYQLLPGGKIRRAA